MARDSEETKRRIVAAARDLLVTHGLEGLSMRKVGQEVGISATAIYRHFEDKDALVSAAVHAGAVSFATYLLRSLSAPDPRSRLRTMGEQYFAFAGANWSDYQLLFMVDCEQIGLDRLDEQAQAATSRTFQLLVDRVLECQGDGVLDRGDATAQAVFFWTAIHGLASAYLSGHLNVPAEAYCDLVQAQLDLTLQALSQDRQPVRAPQE